MFVLSQLASLSLPFLSSVSWHLCPCPYCPQSVGICVLIGLVFFGLDPFLSHRSKVFFRWFSSIKTLQTMKTFFKPKPRLSIWTRKKNDGNIILRFPITSVKRWKSNLYPISIFWVNSFWLEIFSTKLKLKRPILLRRSVWQKTSFKIVGKTPLQIPYLFIRLLSDSITRKMCPLLPRSVGRSRFLDDM